MRAYRDQYASVFNGGQNVVLIGVSNDPVEELASWAKDDDYPFLFTSDLETSGETFLAFGNGLRNDEGMVDARSVFVIGPDGRVAGVIPQFNQVDPAAYDELSEIIDRVTPEPEGLD